METYRGKKVTVMGLGLFGGGVGVTRFFCERGADVLVTDLAPPARLAPSLKALEGYKVRYKLGFHDMADFTDTDLVIVNPAVPPDSPYLEAAERAGVPVDTELNIFLRLCASPVTAVTGTNGKSTTAALIHEMVRRVDERALLGGNIGRSLLGVLGDTAPDVPVVLELSSFQLENLRRLGRSPRVAVVTNISPNHLDRHRTMENYIAAKRAILDYQTADDVAVLNADDPIVAAMAAKAAGRVYTFSMRSEVPRGAFVRDGAIVLRTEHGEETIAPVHSMALKGSHNVENALAAVLAARFTAWNRDAAADALMSFGGLEHRLEFVAEIDGVRYFNDSIATNPRSVAVALAALAGPKVLIAGGYDKKLPFTEMVEAIYSGNVTHVVLTGDTKGRIKADLDAEALKRGRQVPVTLADTFEEAVAAARAAARWGDIVLLSPGCASYGMFSNFEERGRRFKQLVRERTE